MNRAKIIIISLLGLCSSFCKAGEANEDVMRALIVVRLINQIDWHHENLLQKPGNTFKLCVYRDRSITRIFKKHLKGVVIRKHPITTENIVEKEDIVSCHAIYMAQPKKNTVDWLVANNADNKTILVAEGRGYAKQGVHLNIYLNKEGFFDFELNPDAFVNSSHNINRDLLSLGRVLSEQVAQKAKLLRSLINYTEWPDESSIVSDKNKTFQYCAYQNNVFATFVQYFLADKTLKGKKARLKIIGSNDTPQNCQVLLLGNDKQHLLNLMPHREEFGTLLIGHDSGLGEKGVHYNLIPNGHTQGRRFEINLLAFGMTGHVPNFQLLNSAVVAEKDFPAISSLLSQIIQLTQWPGLSEPGKAANFPLNLCVYREKNLFNNLQDFLPGFIAKPQSIKLKLLTRLSVEKPSTKESPEKMPCDAIFIDKLLQVESGLSLIKQTYPEALLITNQIINRKNVDQMPIHFNLLLKPDAISFEMFLNNLSNSGFTATEKLLESAIIVGGNSND